MCRLVSLSIVILAVGLGCLGSAHAATDGAIEIGDLLYVDVYRNEDLSSTVQVDPNGNIQLAYVGQIKVSGLSPDDASARIAKALSRILKNPRVTVSKGGRALASFTGSARKQSMTTDLITLQNADAANLAESLQGMTSDGGNVSFDRDTNTLIITDEPGAIQNIKSVVMQLDNMANQRAQVRIEAKFAEVRAGALKEMGIRWWAQGEDLVGGYYPTVTQSEEAQQMKGTADAFGNERVQPGSMSSGIGRRYINEPDFDRRMNVPVHIPTPGQLFLGFLQDDLDIGAILDMLIADRQAELLANPMIVAVNNNTAEIQSIEQFPYTELGSIAGVGAQYETRFMDIGIKMKVTPHIYQDPEKPYVRLDMDTEVSYPVGSTNGVPIRSVRVYKNPVKMRDGQTLVIGGIFRDEERNADQDVPGLSKLPVFGRFFSHKERSKLKTELVIFVTPTIHRTPDTITWDRMVNVSDDSTTPAANISKEMRRSLDEE